MIMLPSAVLCGTTRLKALASLSAPRNLCGRPAPAAGECPQV